MPLPILPIVMGAVRLAPLAYTAARSAFGFVNGAINTALTSTLAGGTLHHATDGASTNALLRGAEAVIGRDGVRSAGLAIGRGLEYVGLGLVGMTQRVNERYGTPDQPHVVPVMPPVTRGGIVVQSVIAGSSTVNDKGVSLSVDPDLAGSFSNAMRGVVPAQKPEFRPSGPVAGLSFVAP